MANASAQFGFASNGYKAGGAPDYQLTHYAISSSYGSVLAIGDAVTRVNNTSPFIAIATSANNTTGPTLPIVGVFQGCNYVPLGGGAPVWSPAYPGTAFSDATAYVIDAPDAQFLVATLNTAITSANIGMAVNFTTNGLTATTIGAMKSVMVVDQASLSPVTSTGSSALPFRVVDLYRGVGNGSDPTTPFNWVVVAFLSQMNNVG